MRVGDRNRWELPRAKRRGGSARSSDTEASREGPSLRRADKSSAKGCARWNVRTSVRVDARGFATVRKRVLGCTHA
eukprot:207806-Pleurochrysis_carterae.AAC.1